jgi:membrane-anchored mycosin MYCP
MSGSTTEAGAGVHRLPMTARDQIVVNTLHRRLVEDEVRSLFQVTLTVADEAPELDLVLLQPDRAAESPSVDEMLTALYESFATRFGGWVPTFGKNRQVAHVIAENKIDGGAEGPPTEAAPAPELWATGPDSHGRGVTIAVADTAVANRPELTGRLLADPAALLPAVNPEPLDAEQGHGTFVAGLALAAAPAATIHLEDVLDEDGQGDSWEVARAMVRLARAGADVLNLSLGCHTDDDQPPLVLQRALARLGPDVVVVAAAGNFRTDEPRKPIWPAAFDDVLAVGATDAHGARAHYSPDPATSPWVDVQTPGDDVLSLFLAGEVTVPASTAGGAPTPQPFNGFACWKGTSFAAAHVSGLVAAATDPGHVSPREALATVLAKAGTADGRPWLA